MAYNNKREVFPSSIFAGMFNFAAANAACDPGRPEMRERRRCSSARRYADKWCVVLDDAGRVEAIRILSRIHADAGA
jgi:hypothetical protein